MSCIMLFITVNCDLFVVLNPFQLHEQSGGNSFAKKYKFLCVRMSAPNDRAGNDGLTTRRHPNEVDGPGGGSVSFNNN